MDGATPVRGHRWYAAMWDFSVRRESEHYREARRDVAGGARGRVLEIGVGTGPNWAYLPEGIEYTGIEPDPFMIGRARRHASEQNRDVDLLQGWAERLPYPDASVDTVIVTLSLCTVEDQAGSLAEVRRVLRPGGELRFWEHIRPDGRFAGRFYDLIEPLWMQLGGGCHPNRRTIEAIRSAGFEIPALRSFRSGAMPMVVGSAVVPIATG